MSCSPMLLALAFAVLASSAHAYDCSLGCKTTALDLLVCGADGYTYQNDCLALCAGVEIAAKGPCATYRGAYLQSADGLIPAEALTRYLREGFKLVGTARVAADAFDPEESGKLSDRSLPGKSDQPTAEQLVLATRYSWDGFVFAARLPNPVAPETQGFIPAGMSAAPYDRRGMAQPSARSGRKMLTIFGTDDRKEITYNTGYPYSAIGQVFFQKQSGGNYICSGSMISARAFMTAAHCVYERATSSWQKNWQFAAAEYVSGGVTQRPFGLANWAHVTIFSAYTDNSRSWYQTIPVDFAVVQLAADAATLGQKTGWLGWMWASSFNSVLNTAGYPGDKPYTSYWWTWCSVSDSDGADGKIANQCDIAGGQSGSPMFVPCSGNSCIHGVVKGQDGSSNYAAEVTSANHAQLWSWA